MPALTGLRGFAALWVLLYHAWVFSEPRRIAFELAGMDFDLTPFFSLGWAGVQIFFVLSGFLLSLPFARWRAGMGPQPGIGAYFLRRAMRVYPAFYLQLAVLLGLGWWVQRQLLIAVEDIPRYLAMLFVPPPFGVGSSPLNGVWWTLPIELSFYLALPVLSILLAWNGRWLLLALSLLVMVSWRWFVVGVLKADPVVLWAYQLPGALDSFALGMFGALLHVRLGEGGGDGRRFRWLLGGLLPLALLLVYALFRWMHRDYSSYWSVAPIFFIWTPLFSLAVLLVVLAAAARLSFVNAVLGNRAFQGLGVVSYGVYLWHYPVQKWVLEQTRIGTMEGYRFPWLTATSVAVTLVLAGLSWMLVERRAIRWAASRKSNS